MDNSKVTSLSNPEELRQVVELHKQSFKNVLIGQLGKIFLNYYYKKIWQSPQGVILIYKEDGKVIGFISGLLNDQSFYNIEFYIRSLVGIFMNMFPKPIVILNLCRYIKRNIILRTHSLNSELLSIAVTEAYWGKGIGRSLVLAFDEYFKNRNVKIYKVFTDLNFSKGALLYEKLNFDLYKEMNLFGLTLRMYIRKIQ